MPRYQHAVLYLTLLVTGQFPSAWAEPTPPAHADQITIEVSPSLTLQHLLDATMQRDPRLAISEAYHLEAQALQQRADSLFSGAPAIALHHQTDQWNNDRGMREWEAALEIPLWRWGERSASDQLALQARTQAESTKDALRLRMAGVVRDTLWELVIAEERAARAEYAWQTALTLETEVSRRVSAGDLAKTDLLLAQDETLSRQDEYLLASTEHQHALKRYLTQTGLEQRPAQLAERQSDKNVIDDSHPLLREALLRVERAQAIVHQLQQSGSGSPHLTVGTKRERAADTGIEQDSVGIGIRIPFGGGSHSAPGLAAASTVMAEHTSQYGQLRRELELALHEAHHATETLRKEQELAAAQNRIASENLRMARIAFNLGETELSALLRIQNRAFAAARNLSLRQLQLQHAIARYNQAVGELP